MLLSSQTCGAYELGIYGAVNAPSGTALGGFDPVACRFGGAERGDARFTAEYGGVLWLFANAKNHYAFVATPGLFAPMLGGYCAFAVSKGFTASASGESFHIEEDKLFALDSDQSKEQWRAS